MKILYFSWLKEKIGTNSEEIEKPIKVKTIMDLIQFLKNTSNLAFTHTLLSFIISDFQNGAVVFK